MSPFFRWLRSLIEPGIVAGLLLATGGCVTGPARSRAASAAMRCCI